MAVTFTFPTSAQLLQIEQELMPRLEEGRLGLQLFPRRAVDEAAVEWEQRDNFAGLQQLRGLNGEPPSIKKVGSKRYRMDPGHYGEFAHIDEEDLEKRAKIGTWADAVSIDDLVGVEQVHLLQRELDRIELIVWTLMSTGTFSVFKAGTGIVHTDSFPIKQYTPSIAWTTLATAIPLVDLRTVQLNQRGQSARYDRSARAVGNLKTINALLNNTNANDLGGRFRLQYGQTVIGLDDINSVLKTNDLPSIEVYDQGYLDELNANAFVPFIPDGKLIVIGTRPMGQTVGEYLQTRNVNNPDMGAGGYTEVIDSIATLQKIPRRIDVHRGHNGGPVIYYGGAITVMNVF